MITDVLKKVFGSSNERVIKSYSPLVKKINQLEDDVKKLDDSDLAAKTQEFKKRLEQGETLDLILPEAFAVVREASIRTLGMRHFEVQLIGGIVLHQGKIAEMRTGEGKTLAATLPAYLNALVGPVHVVTVNDYLARRDAEWMGQIYNFLGLSVGCVYAGMEPDAKKAAYQADITYGQNNEFGFDYLRDNMKYSLDQLFQRGHAYAIVDEVDSILVDEARTPLIISGPAEDSSETYFTVNAIAPKLKEEEHYDLDLKTKTPTLNEAGIKEVEKLLNIDNLYEPGNIALLHHVNQALKAHTCLVRDVDYVVKDGKIIIVDEFTGRLMEGRRWSDGLHQAIEAKEKIQIQRENQTLASITFQNLFRLYKKLSGMTGTAATEAAEFREIYGLDVVVIPTNMPLIRDDQSDMVFKTRKEKHDALVNDVKEIHETGQPILIGTISIEQSEDLSKVLNKKGVKHKVLNAKQHASEANIVAQAGRIGSVTIATNMAGRGTDIVLGGNPEGLTIEELGKRDPEDPEFAAAFERYQKQCQEEKEQVLEAGGLCILGTERHESRRIDNQLRGRAGRQGDPGMSRFYVSLEDDLMKRFGGEKITQMMGKLGWKEGYAIDGRMISRSIESAQKKVERYHFESRKHVTEYDDVMSKQREVVYNLRNRALHKSGLRDEVESMIDDLAEDAVLQVCDDRTKPTSWNLGQISDRIKFLFNRDYEVPKDIKLNAQDIFDDVREFAGNEYKKLVADQSAALSQVQSDHLQDSDLKISLSEFSTKAFDFEFSTVEQDTILENLDRFWNQHLQEMDSLKEGIGLRSYGQKNPLHEYQKEGFSLFSGMLDNLKEAVVRHLFYFNASELAKVVQHFEEERKRRAALESQIRTTHNDPDAMRNGAGGKTTEEPKDPDQERLT